MRSSVPPTRAAFGRDHAADDLEELLRAYFRAQLPEPWPELRLPKPSIAVDARRPQWSSRSALAAAVAFLLIGSLALSAAFRSNGTAAHPAASAFTATGNPFGFVAPLPAESPQPTPAPSADAR